MQDFASDAEIDCGNTIKWGRSASDYRNYRPDPPESLFIKLLTFGIGRPAQQILDLGTGTGALALQFARMGCDVTGGDIDVDQIEAAKARACHLGLTVSFSTFPAESVPCEAAAYDVVTANQCWPYFDKAKISSEIRRILRRDGRLVVSSFTYLPRESPIASASEKIVRKYNPSWSGADWDGHVDVRPSWSQESWRQVGMFTYDEDVSFTRLSWRGRMRALRAIGPSLSSEQVAAFDREHNEYLVRSAPEQFAIAHRISAHIFQPK